MKRRGIEHLKTALIVLLLLSAVGLTMAANLFGDPLRVPWVAAAVRPFASLFGYSMPEQPVLIQRPTLTDAARPQVISIRSAAGRASWFGDFAALDTAFDALGSFLAEALDTAASPQPLTRRQYRRALEGTSVYFEYPGPLPLPVLAAWLDADTDLDWSAARFALQLNGEAVQLLVDSGDGRYGFETQVDAAALAAALDGYPADGTRFAFEAEESVFRQVDELTLLAADPAAPAAAASVNPCDEAFVSRAANLLGFNPYGDSFYRDESGGAVYTESDSTLLVSADGLLTLRNLGGSSRYQAASAGNADRIELARRTLAELADEIVDDSRLLLSEMVQDGEKLSVRFSYYLAGIPVTQPGGIAAEAVFSGAILTDFQVRLRAYTLDPQATLPCLPAQQAAAIAPPGSRLRLQYADTGGNQLEAGWAS